MSQSLTQLLAEHTNNGIVKNLPVNKLIEYISSIKPKPNGKKQKKKKNPRAPKRPTSAYMLWLKENRGEITKKYFEDFNSFKPEQWTVEFKKKYYAEKNLGIPKQGWSDGKPRIVAVVTTKAGKLWEVMGEKEKEPYVEKFKIAQDKYYNEKEHFEQHTYSEDEEEEEYEIKAPEGWSKFYNKKISTTLKDIDGKTIKQFKSFSEAHEKAISLGNQCYGITQTKRGFSVRIGDLVDDEKTICSFVKMNFTKPIKSKRGRPSKQTSVATSTYISDSDSDSEHEGDQYEQNEKEKISVEEITIDGELYYLNPKTKELYNIDTGNVIGIYQE